LLDADAGRADLELRLIKLTPKRLRACAYPFAGNGSLWRKAVIRQKEAEAELVAKAPILSDGRAGTAETVPLDEDHGLRISIRGHPGAGRFRRSNSRKSKFKRAKVSSSGDDCPKGLLRYWNWHQSSSPQRPPDRNHPFLNSAQQGMQQTPDCCLNPLA